MNECHTSQTLLSFYHREAKKLHRAAHSSQKMKALPVLRRLLKFNVIDGLSLVQLFSNQTLVQRKHLFTLLAKETGYQNWSALKQTLEDEGIEQPHFAAKLQQLGYPNLWFADVNEAQEYVKLNGGEVIEMAGQAIVTREGS